MARLVARARAQRRARTYLVEQIERSSKETLDLKAQLPVEKSNKPQRRRQ